MKALKIRRRRVDLVPVAPCLQIELVALLLPGGEGLWGGGLGDHCRRQPRGPGTAGLDRYDGKS